MIWASRTSRQATESFWCVSATPISISQTAGIVRSYSGGFGECGLRHERRVRRSCRRSPSVVPGASVRRPDVSVVAATVGLGRFGGLGGLGGFGAGSVVSEPPWSQEPWSRRPPSSPPRWSPAPRSSRRTVVSGASVVSGAAAVSTASVVATAAADGRGRGRSGRRRDHDGASSAGRPWWSASPRRRSTPTRRARIGPCGVVVVATARQRDQQPDDAAHDGQRADGDRAAPNGVAALRHPAPMRGGLRLDRLGLPVRGGHGRPELLGDRARQPHPRRAPSRVPASRSGRRRRRRSPNDSSPSASPAISGTASSPDQLGSSASNESSIGSSGSPAVVGSGSSGSGGSGGSVGLTMTSPTTRMTSPGDR